MLVSEIPTKFKTYILKPFKPGSLKLVSNVCVALCRAVQPTQASYVSQHCRYLLQNNFIMIHSMSCRVLLYSGSTVWLLCYWSFIQFHQLQKSWNSTDGTWGTLTHRLLHIKELHYQNHTHTFSYPLEMCNLIQQAFSGHDYQTGHHKTSASSWSLSFIQSLKGQGTWKCMGNAGSTPSVTCRRFELYALHSDPHTTQAILRYRYFRNTLPNVLPSVMNNQRTTVHRHQEQGTSRSL